jgi:murein DD-endopeptidase MepM/ murein hydrolase activator NlpD
LASLSCSYQAAHAADVSISDTSPRQGETLEVTVRGANTLSTESGVVFNGNDYKLFPTSDSGTFTALLAVPADLKPGAYPLEAGGEKLVLHVKNGQFPLQHLRLPPAKDNFDMSPGEKEAVEGAKAELTPQRMWHGPFVRPSKYRTSTAFGVKRVVNGHLLTDYFHSGLDFAAPAGSPVRACSDGTVVLAAKGFKLHGNCVAVDHGQGVISFYIHLKSIAAKKGEHVEAGDKLGEVGQTGRANGPHLHFSIYVNQVATNPGDWFQKSF